MILHDQFDFLVWGAVVFKIYFFWGVEGFPAGFSFQFALAKTEAALFEEAVGVIAGQGAVGVAGDEGGNIGEEIVGSLVGRLVHNNNNNECSLILVAIGEQGIVE